jgi:hypothetical protein
MNSRNIRQTLTTHPGLLAKMNKHLGSPCKASGWRGVIVFLTGILPGYRHLNGSLTCTLIRRFFQDAKVLYQRKLAVRLAPYA